MIDYLRLAFATLVVLLPGRLVARSLGQRTTSASLAWALAVLFVSWALVFIVHGTMDKATKYQGSQFFYDTAGSSDKTLKLYEGHYHDMLNDIGKEEVMGDIVGWLNKRA